MSSLQRLTWSMLGKDYSASKIDLNGNLLPWKLFCPYIRFTPTSSALFPDFSSSGRWVFSLEWQLRLCSFSTFNLKTSRFFISHSPRFFNPLLSVRISDTGNTVPCLIYIVKFLFVKCTLALYVSIIFASLKLLLAYLSYYLIEKDRMGDWSPEKDCCLWLTTRAEAIFRVKW